MLLAGDIGGTKTLLALYAPATGARQPVAEAEFHSADYPGLDVMAREFLAREKRTADHACFDVAGPVIGGRAHLTNLPWDVEEAALCQALGLRRVMLLNDLKAIAYAVPHLQPEDLHSINAGQPEPNGPIAVVAPGTGLGEAFLVWGGSSYIACSSEGGHASFPPTDERQAGLRRLPGATLRTRLLRTRLLRPGHRQHLRLPARQPIPRRSRPPLPRHWRGRTTGRR